MQQHMFWALFIHAAGRARTCATTRRKRGEVWDDLREPARSSSGRRRGRAARPRSATCRRSSRLAARLLHRAAPTTSTGRGSSTTTRATGIEHADIPATFSTGWYDPFPHADSEYFAAMAAKNSAPQRLVDRPVEPRRHARRRDVLPRRRLRPETRLGRAALLRGAARRSSTAGSRTTPRPAAGRGAGADLRDGRRLGPQDARSASSTTAAAGATSRSGRSRAAVITLLYLHGDGSLSTERACGRRRRRAQFTYDPAHPVPTIGGLYCSVGELPADGRWDGAGVGALPQPGAAAPRHAHARAGRPEGVAGVLRLASEPYPRLSERPDVLVFQTEPLDGADRGDGPMHGAPAGSRRARSTPTSPRSSSTSTRRTRTIRRATTCCSTTRSSAAATARASTARCCMEPGEAVPGDDHAAADEQPLRRRPPDPRRHLVVELPRGST